MMTRTARPLVRGATLLLLLLAAAACARGADEARLRADLKTRLDHDVKADLFDVVAVRREGSGPLPAGASGAERVVIYFNATLRLRQDYAFGSWDQLGPSSVSYALGATDKGIYGLQAQNKSGDVVRAYGSAIYERAADGAWTPVQAAPTAAAAAAPASEDSGPPVRSKQLIDRLAAMVELPPPGVSPSRDEIIADELARASENIERRVKRSEHTFTVASGAEGSEYARFTDTLIATIAQLAPNVKLRQRYSQGSVDNAWLLSRGEADYAIVQADVAIAAIAGEDVFAQGGLTSLRAVGGLFPEAIHVIVLPDSPITEIGQLRGRRVDIGERSSGTRFDAVAVLAAYGLRTQDLGEVREEGPAVSLNRLKTRQIDAVFVTAAAPTRALQQLAVEPGLRLLEIKGAAMQRLVQGRPGLSALTLPRNTYPRQQDAVATVASPALLMTTLDAPNIEVQRVAELVFNRMPQQRAGSADVVKTSTSELRGVNVPLHPGAERQSR